MGEDTLKLQKHSCVIPKQHENIHSEEKKGIIKSHRCSTERNTRVPNKYEKQLCLPVAKNSKFIWNKWKARNMSVSKTMVTRTPQRGRTKRGKLQQFSDSAYWKLKLKFLSPSNFSLLKDCIQHFREISVLMLYTHPIQL